ncbi:hypothetical protein AX14_013664 [Amanita brunnescens Koide BX004]|nr:hypothetical protein AX14_013664 [Amanita brunnescens Koide BX004]
MGVSSHASPPKVLFLSHGQVHNNGAAASALRISYRVPFHTRFFCAANSFARLIGITQKAYPNPEDAEEFVPIKNGYRYVENYCDRLCSLYTEPEMHHLRFERWQASEICTYRSQGTAVGHEYLIATLHDADNREIHLRLERGVQVSSTHTHAHVVKGRNCLSEASATSADSAKRGGSPVEGPGRLAINETSIFASFASNEDRQPFNHFRFEDGHHVSLPQLVVLASTIDEYSKTRQFSNHNCYWFCHVISEALKMRFKYKPLSGDGGPQQNRLHNISLHQNVNIGEVLDLYDIAWNRFVQKIDVIVNNPNNRDTRIARQQAEEYRRRADEEERRADEESRKRREAERELAELKALLAQQTGRFPLEQGV